jgi:hypothetical protein
MAPDDPLINPAVAHPSIGLLVRTFYGRARRDPLIDRSSRLR